MDVTLALEEEGSGREETRQVEAEPGAELREVLERADVNPEAVLVEHDGRVVPVTAELEEGMAELRILEVISGG